MQNLKCVVRLYTAYNIDDNVSKAWKCDFNTCNFNALFNATHPKSENQTCVKG